MTTPIGPLDYTDDTGHACFVEASDVISVTPAPMVAGEAPAANAVIQTRTYGVLRATESVAVLRDRYAAIVSWANGRMLVSFPDCADRDV